MDPMSGAAALLVALVFNPPTYAQPDLNGWPPAQSERANAFDEYIGGYQVVSCAQFEDGEEVTPESRCRSKLLSLERMGTDAFTVTYTDPSGAISQYQPMNERTDTAGDLLVRARFVPEAEGALWWVRTTRKSDPGFEQTFTRHFVRSAEGGVHLAETHRQTSAKGDFEVQLSFRLSR